jgi:tetratricopeptide (TPR) repeat protein
MSTDQPEAIFEPWGHVGRASRSPGQLWQVPTFLAGICAFLAVALTAPSRGDNAFALFQAELAQLRHSLEPDQEKPGTLAPQADNLLTHLREFPRQAAEIHFLAGSAYFRLAEQAPPQAVADIQKKAIDHLDEALALNVAPADLPAAKYRLGYALYQQGKDPSRAVDLMAQSVEKGADRRAQAYGVLVKACLAVPRPNLEAALAASQKQLELTDSRNQEEMAQARLQRADLFLRKAQRPDALKELDLIPSTTPRPLLLQARLLQARVCEDEGLWNQAIPVWEELLKKYTDAVPGGKAHVLYALGLACRNADPARLGDAMAHWQQAFDLGGDEGQAAGLRLGEMRLYGPKADASLALATFTKVLENVRTPSDYKIKTLNLGRAREILENACLYLLEKKDYGQTRTVAELYKKIAPTGVADECLAQGEEGLARELSDRAKQMSPPDEAKLKEAHAQFHRAAIAYEQAAAVRTDGAQANSYWRSAQCYLAAKDFSRAGDVLKKFVDLEKNQDRLAEGWLNLAETFVALGGKEKAREAYYKCIEFPLTPFAARARYQLALEEMDKKNYEQARAILMQNLESKDPVQDRSAHEKSIYKIADLFYLLKDFDKAVFYYKKATEQYPRNSGALAARDQLGECYCKLAKQALEKMNNANNEEKKAYYEKARLHSLDQAASVCDDVADELEHKTRQSSLSQAELNLLRKALFGAAEVKFDMNDFAEALRRYQSIQDKYRKQVEGLIAGQRIWRFVGVMVDTPEQRLKARTATQEALKKIRSDLENMPEGSDAFSGGEGVWTKRRWEEWATWVDGELARLGSPGRVSIAP